MIDWEFRAVLDVLVDLANLIILEGQLPDLASLESAIFCQDVTQFPSRVLILFLWNCRDPFTIDGRYKEYPECPQD